MHMFFRTLLLWLHRRAGPSVDMHEVGRIRLRALPSDLDVLGHVNNGVYFSLMDLGRQDLMQRSGAWAKLQALGMYPVAANVTMSYRKSLQAWQRFVLETKIVGYDDKCVFVEQRFVVGGEIYARGYIRARFMKRGSGPVAVAELAELMGVDPSEAQLPLWLARWAADVALPPSRAEAPSVWG